VFQHAAPSRVDRWFRRFQLVSAAAYFTDAWRQRRAEDDGHHTGALVTGGYLTTFEVPLWVILIAHAAIGLGTLSGGWRIIKTMGPENHEAAAARRLCGGNRRGRRDLYRRRNSGIGISTTHTITGAIVGVGATKRLSAVRWGVAGQIVWAWILTIPASAPIGAITYFIISALHLFAS
jgi:PiT family inorganic phosphate transporter